MPSKYVIHTRHTPHRFEAIAKSGIIAWEEGCLKCAVCVKKQCVYGVYDNRGLDARQMVDSIDNMCMSCYRCVQNCPRELIHKTESPEFKALGDAHWTPDIITRLWYQAETGNIPVSGAGYPGPFVGPGFDSMWTDMSEIVRPTRDGIHGREYISTAIDLGKTPDHLSFSDDGKMEGDISGIIDIPLPIIMRVPAFGSLSRETLKGWAMGAKTLGTLLAIPDRMIKAGTEGYQSTLVPVLSPGPIPLKILGEGTRMVEIEWSQDWQKTVDTIQAVHPSLMITVRLPLAKGVEDKALSLIESGISVIHLEGSPRGRAVDDEGLFLKDALRSVHIAIVDKGCRDGITLLASGGITMAENVAKALICGADAVFVDFPINIALECRMCRRCTEDLSCPVEIENAPSNWVASRVINLIGAWHNQLLEVMGAMGIREARRLRGETGRAMFFEQLDEESFGTLGELKDGYELE
ncbi:MAG: hypothetical protein JRF65_08985 [Deltaproteobacteria bacterium]|nr:hypothetical protein [Deltaproteobacteria bacterium]